MREERLKQDNAISALRSLKLSLPSKLDAAQMNVRRSSKNICITEEKTMQSKLRWILVNNKTICEKYIDGEWIAYNEGNDELSRFFSDSTDEHVEQQTKSNIIFKGI